jgi:phage antirepressor YoqD-like protein
MIFGVLSALFLALHSILLGLETDIKIFKLLRDENVLRYNNEPYQLQVDTERFKVIEQPFQTVNGETYIGRKTLITQKGLDYILKIMNGVK